ncbi:MAG: hypothetical protein H0V17_02285 [Deltaproteobacteria bacterium]|nr:hypothetical protein [Deltaproteobacteria bacterium]
MKQLLWSVVALGCGGGGNSPADSAAPDDSTPDSGICVPDTGAPTVIFLNRGGGTYTSGPINSSANTTNLVNQSTTIPAPTIVEADFTAFLACINDRFAPFNVTRSPKPIRRSPSMTSW